MTWADRRVIEGQWDAVQRFVENRYLAGPGLSHRQEGPVESPAEVIWNNQTARKVAWERDRAFVQAFWTLHQEGCTHCCTPWHWTRCDLWARAKALGLA